MSTSYLFESTMPARIDREEDAVKMLTEGMKYYTKRFETAINGTCAVNKAMIICAAELALRPLRQRLKNEPNGEELLAALHEAYDDDVIAIDLTGLTRTRKEARKDDD